MTEPSVRNMAKIAKATNERGSPLRALDHSMAGVETISEHSGQYERRQNPLDLVEDQRDCDQNEYRRLRGNFADMFVVGLSGLHVL